MTRNRTGNNQFLKQYNQAGILDLIRVYRSISRAELSQLSGLSPTAIGVIISSLLEKGYIHETGTGESKGGRRPVLLELRPESFYTVGVDLDVGSMSLVLIDITGKMILEDQAEVPEEAAFEETARIIESTVAHMVEMAAIDEEKLIGIGISVPGMVDSVTQQIILAPNLGWENADMKARLDRYANIPVYVENEAMASAICENWLGSCRDVDHFVCINIKSGIGAGIFTGGRLYRGAGGSAGEVGHIVVDENGPRCGCGNYGCLEAMASTSRIVEKARRLVRQGIVSSLNEYPDIDRIGIDQIVKAAREQDQAAMDILSESARYVGIAISNIVNTLNPSKIVLGKEFTKYADLVLDRIMNIVRCKALKAPASRVEIVASALGEKSSKLGAAIIPLKVLFGR